MYILNFCTRKFFVLMLITFFSKNKNGIKLSPKFLKITIFNFNKLISLQFNGTYIDIMFLPVLNGVLYMIAIHWENQFERKFRCWIGDKNMRRTLSWELWTMALEEFSFLDSPEGKIFLIALILATIRSFSTQAVIGDAKPMTLQRAIFRWTVR